MAQSLLTQRGVEYGSTMRTLQATKKHLTKKWRSRSCSESSSDSCSSSSDSDGESSQSSATAEREFSIVKESNFANGPLKLKIAARRVKKDVGNGAYDQEDDSVDSPPLGSDSGQVPVVTNVARVVTCVGESNNRKQHCKRKIEKLLSLLVTCVYSRSLGTHRKPGHKKHRFHTDLPWDLTPRKRDHINRVDECCPSVTEIIQPRGGVSKSGRILELYRDPNSTQSFYQTSCREGVKGQPCQYVGRRSMCVQRYTYTYALVREFNSNGPWRLDYIRVRSGCSCEVKAFYGRRKKDVA